MARIYPANPPPFSSSAEEQLYHLFSGLPDDFRVFHGVRWRHRDSADRFLDARGEIDFVLLHARFGLLLLEAKGGKLRRDGDSGAWYSENSQGQESQIDDPFVQIDENSFAFRKLLEEGVSTRRHHYRVQTGVALIQTVVRGPIALHAPRHAVIDSSDIPDLEAAVIRLYGEPLKHPLAPEAMEAVTEWMSPSLSFVKVGLNARFEEIDRTRIAPTESQRFLLDHLETVPRARIMGCAGSGKTLLALEKARRLARAGHEVLLLCFNRQLARWAESAVRDGTFPATRVKVRHFHGLADDACAAAGVKLLPNPDFPDWENVPARMEAALARVPMKFDAIVVDEGQDFEAAWWLIIMGELLRRPDDDPLYVFYDGNQRIYTDRLELPDDLPCYPLTTNLRNTRQIHEEVLRYYQGHPLPGSSGPEGVEVARLHQPALKGVQQALDELVIQQRVPTDQIILLTGRAQNKSDFKEGRRLGGVGLTWHPPRPGEVQVATVHSFKGLERAVVILAELDHHWRDQSRRQYAEALQYIGASRATNHLVLVSEEPAD